MWIEQDSDLDDEHIHIDGKKRNAFNSINSLNILSAWSSRNKSVIGQVRVKTSCNEVSALPKLLQSIYLRRKIVTTDALNTQKVTAKYIV